MAKYDYADNDRQKIYEAFASQDDQTDLSNELAILRQLIQQTIKDEKSVRLTADLISQLTKTAVAVEAMEIRSKKLLPLSQVNQIIYAMCEIIKLTLDEQGLSQDQIDQIIAGIQRRVAAKRAEILLIEDHTNERSN